jgi:hypothetical protein
MAKEKNCPSGENSHNLVTLGATQVLPQIRLQLHRTNFINELSNKKMKFMAQSLLRRKILFDKSIRSRIRDRCYDFLIIFAKKFGGKSRGFFWLKTKLNIMQYFWVFLFPPVVLDTGLITCTMSTWWMFFCLFRLFLANKNSVLEKDANFFAENCRKSPKIVIITSTPVQARRSVPEVTSAHKFTAFWMSFRHLRN